MLNRIDHQYIPPELAQKAKLWLSSPRYRLQLWNAKWNYRRQDCSYKNPLLFVAGLPKSGSSWTESMLASYPGYKTVTPPQAIVYEQKHKGSHNFNLKKDTLAQLKGALVVLKLHIHGSSHNVRILQEKEIPYVVLYRDLRDVAVSHYFYVRRTPWHPEYEDYCDLDVEDGLRYFSNTLLPEFVNWMRSWRQNRNPEQSIELRYEDLLDDTVGEFRRVTSHFSLNTSASTIEKIVEAHRFKNMSGGRARGDQDPDSFIRRGIAGDWKRHFTPEIKKVFKKRAGQVLIDFGYEMDLNW